ncbi:hypothetical protein ACFLXT_01495 [Chloroflexota bacterium]
MPVGNEHTLLIRVANADPTALDPVVSVLVQRLNNGLLDAGDERPLIDWLNDFATISEHLCSKIVATISKDVLDYYGSDHAEQRLRINARQLSETLRAAHPRRLFRLM